MAKVAPKAWLFVLLVGVSLLYTGVGRAEGVASKAEPALETSKQGGEAERKRPRLGLLATRVRAGDALLGKRARTVDELLSVTAEDLGLLVEFAPPTTKTDHLTLRRRARKEARWIMMPSLVRLVGKSKVSFELRLVVAVPGERYVRIRSERFTGKDLDLRVVVALRDLVRTRTASGLVKSPARGVSVLASRAGYSAGRSVLATSATLYGGFLGYSLQRASGSNDPRLLYPLMAVGSGLGLGISTLVANEWDIGVGDAWYLSGGAWWPALAGQLIYRGRFGSQPSFTDTEAWRTGLIASVAGVGLASMGLIARPMDEGAALMAHSSGGLGLVVGGLVDFGVRGDTNDVPLAGMGYGAMAGWLLGSTTAIYFRPSAGRMTVIDLGVLLGGLVGASAASPLIFAEPNQDKTRGWVGASGAGMVLGGVTAWYLTRETKSETEGIAYVPTPTWMMTGPGLQWSGAW